eukprot:349632-Chlamydomonas_euryale.AAC.56
MLQPCVPFVRLADSIQESACHKNCQWAILQSRCLSVLCRLLQGTRARLPLPPSPNPPTAFPNRPGGLHNMQASSASKPLIKTKASTKGNHSTNAIPPNTSQHAAPLQEFATIILKAQKAMSMTAATLGHCATATQPAPSKDPENPPSLLLSSLSTFHSRTQQLCTLHGLHTHPEPNVEWCRRIITVSNPYRYTVQSAARRAYKLEKSWTQSELHRHTW